MSVEVKNLRYIYNEGLPGETVALDDVSFAVPEPSVLSIIGHTGSGKSTLLQHLNGLLKPNSGEVYIDGECITDGKKNLVDIRRKVGLVFQYPEYQLFEESVAKDVAFGPRNLGLDDEEIDRRVRAALEIVGIDYDERADKSPFEMSGGNKRRIAIAGVLAMEPEILILDEPTAGLDPAAHRAILAMIHKLQQERELILIFVSHNMADVAAISDRVIVMNEGRIVMDASPEEVFSHYDELASMGLAVTPAGEIAAYLKKEVPGFESKSLTEGGVAEDIKAYMK